jgi:hypothetical protein
MPIGGNDVARQAYDRHLPMVDSIPTAETGRSSSGLSCPTFGQHHRRRPLVFGGRLLTPEPAPTEPNATHADRTISVPAAPPDAADADGAIADRAISIANAAYANSGGVAVIRAAYTDCCDTIPVPTPTPGVAINGIIIIISRVGIS